jgi:hypothetical protein
MEVSGQNYAPTALSPGKGSLYPFYGRLGEHYGEEKYPFPLLGIEPQLLGRPACNIVTILTALSQLPMPTVTKCKTDIIKRSSEHRGMQHNAFQIQTIHSIFNQICITERIKTFGGDRSQLPVPSPYPHYTPPLCQHQ